MLHNSAIPHTDVIPARRRLLAYHSLLCLEKGENPQMHFKGNLIELTSH